MELTRREFVAIIAATGLPAVDPVPAGAEPANVESSAMPLGGDDHPVFSEFAEARLLTQWEFTP